MRTKKIAIIASLLIVTLVTSLITIFSKQNTKTNEVALQESKKLSTQSTISYEEVKSGDSDVYYTDGDSQVKIDNFELDAYFIEDSQKQRGVTRNLSEITNLSVIVNASQFVNMKIKNLRMYVSDDGIVPTCTTSDSADGVIQQAYDKSVYFNDIQGGINSTINFSSSAMNASQLSSCTSTFIGFDKFRLKIPIIDFASTTYLPEVKSTSKSYFETMFTNSFTSLIELSIKLNVFINHSS